MNREGGGVIALELDTTGSVLILTQSDDSAGSNVRFITGSPSGNGRDRKFHPASRAAHPSAEVGAIPSQNGKRRPVRSLQPSETFG